MQYTVLPTTDLREEILHLQQQIGAPLDTSISSQQEIRELREKLRESEKLLTESTRYIQYSGTPL